MDSNDLNNGKQYKNKESLDQNLFSDLELEPSNNILFNKLNNTNKTTFSIKNTTKKKISYEIKTNFSDKYKYSFEPSFGVLNPYQRHKIDAAISLSSNHERNLFVASNDRIKIYYSFLDESLLMREKTNNQVNGSILQFFLSLLIILPMSLIVYLILTSFYIPSRMFYN